MEISSNNISKGNVAEKKAISSELLYMLRDGNPIAFKTIYTTFYNPLENFLYMLLRDRTEAEDMTQNVFAKIWEFRHEIDPEKNFKTYLYVIARNSVMNFFKRKKVINKFQDHILFQDNFENSPDEAIYAKETELLIQLTVERMPKTQKMVYDMSVTEGLSNDEIAQRLGLNKANVANHVAHAKKAIRQILTIWLIMFIW